MFLSCSRRRPRQIRVTSLRRVRMLCSPTPFPIQEGDLVLVSLPYGKYRVAKVEGFDYSGRTADVLYLEEDQDEYYRMDRTQSKSFESLSNLMPIKGEYSVAKGSYHIPASQIEQAVNVMKSGQEATAVVQNPPPSAFKVPKPTKNQARIGSILSFLLSIMSNQLFIQIRSNEYADSQWFARNFAVGIELLTYISLFVGSGLILWSIWGPEDSRSD
eukprot:jgi/Galph1/5614/GphlegSOOS_G4222.1